MMSGNKIASGRTDMSIPWKQIILLICLLALILLLWLTDLHHFLTFENILKNRDIFFAFIDQNYVLSVSVFLMLYVFTAFFIPGTLALTAAAGFFFGFAAGTVYSLTAACIGAVLSFLTSRHIIGSWIQQKFSDQLEIFNREIVRHGPYYLLVFRIVPLLPFFVVNYIAGLTRVSTWTFVWTTAAGMLPGALACTYAGRQLGAITSPDELLSPGVVISLVLLAVLIILPPVIHHMKRFLV